jgi:hypothetical protein
LDHLFGYSSKFFKALYHTKLFLTIKVSWPKSHIQILRGYKKTTSEKFFEKQEKREGEKGLQDVYR